MTNQKHKQWLKSELPKWIESDFINEQSASALADHYQLQHIQEKKWSLEYILTGVAALMIGLGVILLVAYNWSELSRVTRTFISFLPVIAAQIFALFAIKKQPDLQDAAGLLLCLCFGASFSLVAQTYHTYNDLGAFLKVWFLVCLAIPFFLKSKLALLLLWGLFVWALLMQTNDYGNAMPHFEELGFHQCFWILLAATAYLSFYEPQSSVLKALWYFAGLVFTVINLLIFFDMKNVSPLSVFHKLLTCLGFAYGAEYVLEKLKEFKPEHQQSYALIENVSVIPKFAFYVAWLSFSLALVKAKSYDITGNTYSLELIGIFAITLLLVLFYYAIKEKHVLSLLAHIWAVVLLIFQFTEPLPLIINGLIVLTVATILAFSFKNKRASWLNFGVIWILALIAVHFFDADISLLLKGIAFIISGVTILAINKYFKRMTGVSHA